jgi:tetratricopeptide (TPR) repeat protein
MPRAIVTKPSFRQTLCFAAIHLAVLACVSKPAAAAEPAYDSGGTPTAEMALVDADRAAYHGRYTKALAHDNRAIAISPDFAIAYLVRAHHYMDMGRYDAALADIARLETMHPDSIEVPMARAQIALRHADGAAAMTQMNLAVQMRNRSYWHAPHQGGLGQVTGGNYYVTDDHTAALIFAYTSLAEQMLHQDEASIQDMQHMMNYDSTRPWYVLSQHCYIAAVAGLLDTAELTCQEAIDGDSHDIGQYDSLGFTHLRMKAWDKAIADYTKALYYRDDLTISLYGRGIAKRAKGDIAGGDADIAAATRDEPDIANIMKRLGAPSA